MPHSKLNSTTTSALSTQPNPQAHSMTQFFSGMPQPPNNAQGIFIPTFNTQGILGPMTPGNTQGILGPMAPDNTQGFIPDFLPQMMAPGDQYFAEPSAEDDSTSTETTNQTNEQVLQSCKDANPKSLQELKNGDGKLFSELLERSFGVLSCVLNATAVTQPVNGDNKAVKFTQLKAICPNFDQLQAADLKLLTDSTLQSNLSQLLSATILDAVIAKLQFVFKITSSADGQFALQAAIDFLQKPETQQTYENLVQARLLEISVSQITEVAVFPDDIDAQCKVKPTAATNAAAEKIVMDVVRTLSETTALQNYFAEQQRQIDQSNQNADDEQLGVTLPLAAHDSSDHHRHCRVSVYPTNQKRLCLDAHHLSTAADRNRNRSHFLDSRLRGAIFTALALTARGQVPQPRMTGSVTK